MRSSYRWMLVKVSYAICYCILLAGSFYIHKLLKEHYHFHCNRDIWHVLFIKNSHLCQIINRLLKLIEGGYFQIAGAVLQAFYVFWPRVQKNDAFIDGVVQTYNSSNSYNSSSNAAAQHTKHLLPGTECWARLLYSQSTTENSRQLWNSCERVDRCDNRKNMLCHSKE